MCGIAGIVGRGWIRAQLTAMVGAQRHRGPDTSGSRVDSQMECELGHNRLSIIDLSPAGQQPMSSADGTIWIAFNGEIYNYLELRAELGGYPFRTRTDTEVVLAAYERWGIGCIERFVGMFAFLLWDERERRLHAVRDRFGVKPLYYHEGADALFFASEIKALHAAGAPVHFDAATWATYLAAGVYDHSANTFWEGIRAIPAGHRLVVGRDSSQLVQWYDVAERAGREANTTQPEEVADRYLTLLGDSVRLRFRSDVQVGINLSGGLDSSLLLGLVQATQGADCEVRAFTFVTGDERYDELPWVQLMLANTRHPLSVVQLTADEVPALAEAVQQSEDEPFGGIPTLAYGKLFERASADGVTVLLDGQGMDEQWAGYDYYATPSAEARVIQGTAGSATRPGVLNEEFRSLARPMAWPRPFGDRLRDLQYRDVRFTKLPRALRFNDRVSMRASTELREPFLDHRLVEFALPQPEQNKIRDGVRKWLPRRVAATLLPSGIAEAPKRPVQTPQREWLRGPLREWATECIDAAIAAAPEWLNGAAVREELAHFNDGHGDNGFFVWQWISLGMLSQVARERTGATLPTAASRPVSV